MGQNVNYLLGNQQTMLGADPELYRQQLLQQEQQRIAALPAQNQLGAQLGTLLGRGLVNVAQDRGFFEVTNPVLQNLTKIQGVYNTAMQTSDPNDPLSFYKNLQAGFADAGLGQQALMANQELRRVQTEMTKAKGEELRTQAAQTEVYKNNRALLESDIAKFREQGNDAKANELAQLLGQFTVEAETKQKKDLLGIELLLAQTATEKARVRELNAKADAGRLDKTVIPDSQGGGVIVYTDAKTGKQVERVVVTSDIMQQYLSGGGKPGAKPAGEKPSAASFDKRNASPAAAPSAPAPAQAAPSAPAPAPAAAAPVTPYDQNTGTYRIALDPVYQQIQAEAQQNIQRLQTDPTYQADINRRILELQNRIKANFGNMVVIQ